MTALTAKLEARWADGRTRVAGANITAADYSILTSYTSVTSNANLRNPSLTARLTAIHEGTTNVKRVVAAIKGDCQASVDALQPAWI